jgi:SAM-dependent methyltransferase
MSLQEWDERYLRGEAGEDSPETLLVDAVANLPPGRALDLACGPGRNAIWLAQRGWTVTAVDGSRVAIEMLRRRATERGVAVDAVVADLESGGFEIQAASWDLIVMCRYLQRDLFAPVREGLVAGGLAVVVVLMNSERGPCARYRAGPGELAAYFEGFEVLHYREVEVAEIVARTPGPGSVRFQ